MFNNMNVLAFGGTEAPDIGFYVANIEMLFQTLIT